MSEGQAAEVCARPSVRSFRTDDGRYIWEPNPLVVVVSGPSGAGKDAVIAGLRQKRPSMHFVVTATSRPPRPSERHGVDYYFLPRDEFERRLECGEFLENDEHFGHLYGVLRSELSDALARGHDVVLRVDVKGAATLRGLLPEAVFVFVMAESEQEHLRRLQGRGSEGSEALDARLARLKQEVACLPDFDYVVVNRCGRLEEAISTLDCIVCAEKARVHRGRQRPASPPCGDVRPAEAVVS